MDLSFYTNFSSSLANQEAQIALLQQQISTGLAVQTPDQNPVAYASAAIGGDQVDTLTSEAANQAAIEAQLGTVSDSYSSASTLLNNVQSIVEEALNGTTNSQDMQSLAGQVTAAGQQMLSFANTQGTGGSYIFGGTRSSIAPFQVDATSSAVTYLGDGGTSQTAITPSTDVSSIANGEVFVAGLTGDGTSTITAASSNTGSATLVSEGVANTATATAFQQGSSSITLSFASGTDGLTYTATDAGGTVLGTGNVSSATDGTTSFQVAGSTYEIQGTPAAGDNFTISPSRPQTVFALLQNIAAALSTGSSTSATAAQTRQSLNQSLAGLAQYQQDFLTAEGQTGVTLSAVQTAGTSDSEESATIQVNDNAATAVNTPAVLTSLDENLTAVQAAMAAFSDAQKISLFNYL